MAKILITGRSNFKALKYSDKKTKSNTTIVVPTIRENSIKNFLSVWEQEFKKHNVIVVEDNPYPTFNLPSWIEHYSWEDIDKELGKNSWIIPRRSDTVRSYGFYKAWQKETDFILTLDDDCLPEKNYEKGFLRQIKSNLKKKWPEDSWWSTLDGVYTRGYPYKIRNQRKETVIHHGLWSHIPDLDAKTQRKMPNFRTKPAKEVMVVPKGKFFPLCGMNLAFKAKVTPILYFLLMGKDKNEKPWPYDRSGDIWAGIFAKKIIDHLGFAVSSGAPSVFHSRASNVDVNYKKEKPGYPIQEILWQRVADVYLTKSTFVNCYKELAQKLNMDGEYWRKLKKAMLIWASLFET